MWKVVSRVARPAPALSIRGGSCSSMPPAYFRTDCFGGSVGSRRAFGGFTSWDDGMIWYPNRAELEKAEGFSESSVIVAKGYLTEKVKKSTGEFQQVKKYSFFDNYDEFAKKTAETDVNPYHEVLPKGKPRCLYFDIDGKPVFKKLHDQIVGAMQHLVYWFFFRDRGDVSADQIIPVVMTTDSPNKYSCHLVFPQIQFKDQIEQNTYLSTFFKCLNSIQDDFSFLPRLVDKQPYGVFQCFRGPRACKVDCMLEDAPLKEDSALIPQEFFNGDELTGFIGYVNPAYKISLEPLEQIVEQSDFKKAHHCEYIERSSPSDYSQEFRDDISRVSLLGLFVDEFIKDEPAKILEIPEGDAADEFQIYLNNLHPDRAHHYLSWRWISNVAYRLIADDIDNAEYKEKVMSIFLNWASAYPYYDEQENVRMVEMWARYNQRTLGFIYDLVTYDNPGVEIKSAVVHVDEAGSSASSVKPDWDLPELPPDAWEAKREAQVSGSM